MQVDAFSGESAGNRTRSSVLTGDGMRKSAAIAIGWAQSAFRTHGVRPQEHGLRVL